MNTLPLKQLLVTTLLIIGISILGCKKQSPILKTEYTTITYKQTSCADAWATGSTDSLSIVNLVNYLNTKNLYIAGCNIKQDFAPDNCYACTCLTGKVYYVFTFNNKEMLAQYAALGFR